MHINSYTTPRTTDYTFGIQVHVWNSQRAPRLQSSATSRTSCSMTNLNSTHQLHMPTLILTGLLVSKHNAPLEASVYNLLAALLHINANFNIRLRALLWRRNSWRPVILQKSSCSYGVYYGTYVFRKRLPLCCTRTTMVALPWVMLKNPYLVLNISISNTSWSMNEWNVTSSYLTALTPWSICPITLPRPSSQSYFIVMEIFSSDTYLWCIHQFISLLWETSPTTRSTLIYLFHSLSPPHLSGGCSSMLQSRAIIFTVHTCIYYGMGSTIHNSICSLP